MKNYVKMLKMPEMLSFRAFSLFDMTFVRPLWMNHFLTRIGKSNKINEVYFHHYLQVI